VSKSSIGIGAVMLATAAVFIYFDEPLYVRIIAGIIFVAGAILLYQTLARGETEEPTLPATSPNEERPAAAAVAESATAGSTSRSMPLTTESAGTEEVPPELYRNEAELLPHDDPRAEFDFLTNKLLQAIREHVLGYTVGLYWINLDREQIIIGEFVTDSGNFTTARRMNLGNDLISRVGLEGTPAIVSDISSAGESDLVIYYDITEGVRSFIGVPMFFGDEVIAVLAADSKAADAFGMETIASIGRFTSLITLLLGSYNQKFDLAADARMLGILDAMQQRMEEQQDPYGIAGVAVTAVTEIMDWDYTAIVLHSPERQAWIVVKSLAKAANLPYIAEGVTVDMEGSVFRAALEHPDGMIIDVPVAPAWRFHEKEAINSFGQICVLPLMTARAYYGLIVVEYRETHQYARQDLNVLKRIAQRAAQALEVARLDEQTRKHLIVDEVTQTASRTLLLQRLKEEQARLSTVGGNGVFFLAALDRPDELVAKHGEHEIDRIMARLGSTLREHVKPYDVLGRFDHQSFGLLLPQSSPEDAFLRGEKIRKSIAGNVITHGGSTYSVSMSIAGCTVSQHTDVDHILRLSRQALDRAVADGGNCVKVV
jgi:diguanylate cyclase (GGDEF)-like protein